MVCLPHGSPSGQRVECVEPQPPGTDADTWYRPAQEVKCGAHNQSLTAPRASERPRPTQPAGLSPTERERGVGRGKVTGARSPSPSPQPQIPLVTPALMHTEYVSEGRQAATPAWAPAPACPGLGRNSAHCSLSALVPGQLHVVLHPETTTRAQGGSGPRDAPQAPPPAVGTAQCPGRQAWRGSFRAGPGPVRGQEGPRPWGRH